MGAIDHSAIVTAALGTFQADTYFAANIKKFRDGFPAIIDESVRVLCGFDKSLLPGLVVSIRFRWDGAKTRKIPQYGESENYLPLVAVGVVFNANEELAEEKAVELLEQMGRLADVELRDATPFGIDGILSEEMETDAYVANDGAGGYIGNAVLLFEMMVIST